MLLKIILTIGLLTLLAGCQVQYYYDYRYILVNEKGITTRLLDSTVTLVIPVNQSEIQRSKILDSCCKLIASSQTSILDRYIRDLKKQGVESSDYYIVKIWQRMNMGEYTDAADYLNRVDSTEFSKLKTLLEVDLNYELKRKEHKLSFAELLEQYQKVADKFPNDTALLNTVRYRARFLRYKN